MSVEPLPASQPGPSINGIIAQNLLIARTMLNWTQQQLANASGVSRATIAQLEAGLGDPRISTLESLAGALYVTSVFLLLDQGGFRALTEVKSDDALLSNLARRRSFEALDRAIHSGRYHGRMDAARLGADAVRDAGLTGNAQRVGAGIGSARFASKGTFFGAQLADLVDRYRSRPIKRTDVPPPKEEPPTLRMTFDRPARGASAVSICRQPSEG